VRFAVLGRLIARASERVSRAPDSAASCATDAAPLGIAQRFAQLAQAQGSSSAASGIQLGACASGETRKKPLSAARQLPGKIPYGRDLAARCQRI
jgi:hypothetical protein